MKFHRETLISNISYSSKLTCPLGANQAFEGLIRLSICCPLRSFSTSAGLLRQVIPVTTLIYLQAACNQRLTATGESIGNRDHAALHAAATKDTNMGQSAKLNFMLYTLFFTRFGFLRVLLEMNSVR